MDEGGRDLKGHNSTSQTPFIVPEGDRIMNKVFIIGNLTRDPELKYTQTGNPICNVGIAINRVWKDKQGNKQESTCFIELEIYGNLTKVVADYCRKGKQVGIVGRLKQNSWIDQEQKKRSRHAIVVENLKLLGTPQSTNKQEEIPTYDPGDEAPF